MWWFFYASCHGKGMQDAAGAWIKTRVSKSILLGGGIRSVREFFDYCLAFLTCQAELQSRKGSAAFTSSRRFCLLETDELAQFRANAEQVTTWPGARECHFFWAGKEENQVGRKWVGCTCVQCLDENFEACKKKATFVVDGVDFNASCIATLHAVAPTELTRADDIAASLKVLSLYISCASSFNLIITNLMKEKLFSWKIWEI